MAPRSKQPEITIKRVGIYLRVSDATEHKTSARERKGRSTNGDYTSIDAQRDRALAYVQSQPGWRFVAEYVDDGRSGKDLQRDAVQRMFADLEAGKIDVVVVYKIDRLSRSLRDFVEVMNRFDKLGVTFASVTQNFQTDTPVGRLTLNILASFAEFEREMIVERTRDKIASTRAQGMWSGGLPPLGYDLIDGALVVNESEAATVRDIFASYLDTHSSRDVARMLNAQKRPIKKRGKHARAWTPDMVVRVLHNPTVTGVIVHGENTYPGKHDAILDHETFERARAALQANTIEAERKGRNPEYILQGILRCTCTTLAGRTCDSGMAPATSGNRKGTFRYYRCVGRDKGRDGCKARALPATAIESFVVDRLRDIATQGKVAAHVKAHARELVKEHRPAIAAHVEATNARIAKLAEQSASLAERMVRAKPTARATMADRAERLQAELTALESNATESRKRLEAIDTATSESEWIAEQLANFPVVWDLLTDTNRGRLLRGLVRAINVDEPQHKIAIVFAPLDETRRIVLGERASDSDPFVSIVEGNVYRERSAHAVSFGTQAPVRKARSERPAKVARMLALAHHLNAAIRTRACPDLATMAERLRMTRPRITQIVSLTFLAPDIQDEILHMTVIDGREPLRERALRPLTELLDWDRQRAAWAFLKDTRSVEAKAPTSTPAKRGKAR